MRHFTLSCALVTLCWASPALAGDAEEQTVTVEPGTAPVLRVLKLADEPHAMAASPDSKLVALGVKEHVLVIDVATGKRVLAVSLGRGYVRALAWSRDGRMLAAGHHGRGLVLLDATSGKVLRETPGHVEADPRGGDRPPRSTVYGVAFSPDGKTVWTTSTNDTHLRIWNVADGRPGATLDLGFEIEHLAASPDGGLLAVAATDGDLVVLDAASLAVRWKQTLRGIDPALAFSPDSKRLAAGVSGGGAGAKILDAATGKETGSVSPAGDRGLAGIAWLPDGRRLVTVTHGTGVAPVILWTLTDGQAGRKVLEEDYEAHEDADTAVVLGLGGTVAVVAGDDDEVRMYDLR